MIKLILRIIFSIVTTAILTVLTTMVLTFENPDVVLSQTQKKPCNCSEEITAGNTAKVDVILRVCTCDKVKCIFSTSISTQYQAPVAQTVLTHHSPYCSSSEGSKK